MVTIVTDSTVCITKEEAAYLGVLVVPVSYRVGGQMYNETYSGHNGSFERFMGLYGGECSSSGTAASVFASTFAELLRRGSEVLCITISSRLSGIFSSASIAAGQMPSGRIRVVDSLSTAGGMYLLMKKARELLDQGLGLEETALAVEKMREKVGIAFTVDDMAPLRKSRRLGFVRQSVGTILNIKPLLMCSEGAVVSHDIVRGRQEQIRRLIQTVPKDVAELTVHCMEDCRNGEILLQELKKTKPNINLRLSYLGPVLRIYLGRGALGLAWIRE